MTGGPAPGTGQADFEWPARPDQTIVVADASTDVERRLLTDWIAASGNAPSDLVVVETDRIRHADVDAVEQAAHDESATFVPVRVVWLPDGGLDRSGPRLRDLVMGDPRHPNEWMARLILKRHPERARCVAGEPATVADLHARHQVHGAGRESFGAFVLRSTGVTLDLAERHLHGRRYKVPRFVREGVLSSPQFDRAIRDHASAADADVDALVREASSHLDEMVAEPSSFFIDWAGKASRWIADLGYREIVVDDASIERARAVVRDHPSALLFTHKTHLDGIALMSVLYDNDFPAPHVMAGINMSFTGLGFTIRKSGGIFIRRSFQDEPVYKLTLQQYLGFLMGKRFPFMWSFEGTRSRSGKLLPPKYGMLKYVVDAANATDATDLHLIPVSINYDLLGDVSDYAGQELGKPKEAESLSWFVGYLRRLRSPMGRIYLDFADPVVIEGPVPPANEADLPGLAFEIARRANDCVPVTLPALLCTVLLGASPVALTSEELVAQMQELFDWLRSRDIRLADGFVGDHADIEDLAEVVFDKGLVHRYDSGVEEVFTIPEDQHSEAGYYRNTIVHYFLDKAMAELALAGVVDVVPEERESRFWDDLRWLRDALKFEFFHTPSERFADAIDNELSRSASDWTTTLAGSRDDIEALIVRTRPMVGHSVLRPYIESYGVVAEVFARLGDEEGLDEKESTARSLALAEQWYLQRRITSRASIGKLMFAGAHKLLADKKLDQPSPGVADQRRQLADRFAALSRDLARLQNLSDLRRPPDAHDRAPETRR